MPPFDSDAARGILEASLGKKVDEVFEQIDEEPIAAASLGQVRGAGAAGSGVRTGRREAVPVLPSCRRDLGICSLLGASGWVKVMTGPPGGRMIDGQGPCARRRRGRRKRSGCGGFRRTKLQYFVHTD